MRNPRPAITIVWRIVSLVWVWVLVVSWPETSGTRSDSAWSHNHRDSCTWWHTLNFSWKEAQSHRPVPLNYSWQKRSCFLCPTWSSAKSQPWCWNPASHVRHWRLPQKRTRVQKNRTSVSSRAHNEWASRGESLSTSCTWSGVGEHHPAPSTRRSSPGCPRFSPTYTTLGNGRGLGQKRYR